MSIEVGEAIRKARMEHFRSLFKNIEKTVQPEQPVRQDIVQKSVQETKKSEEPEMEKGEIAWEVGVGSCSGKPLTVKKSGKEIKQHIADKVLPELEAELKVLEHEISDLLAKCDGTPEDNLHRENVEVPYKVFPWQETEYYEDRKTPVAGCMDGEKCIAPKFNYPASPEVAQARSEYNGKVYHYGDVKLDIKVCEYLKDLKDGDVYDLTTRQLAALRF